MRCIKRVAYYIHLAAASYPWVGPPGKCGWVEGSDNWMMVTILHLSVAPNPLMDPPLLHQPKTAAAYHVVSFATFQGREWWRKGETLIKKSSYSGRGPSRHLKIVT